MVKRSVLQAHRSDREDDMASPFPPQAAPSPPASASAEARAVAAGNGSTWWGEGWRLFAASPGMWILLVVVLFVIAAVLSFIPVAGHIASQVLYPVFLGGLMLGCRAIDRGEPLTFNHLFAGFSERAGPLLMVGVIYTALVIALTLAVVGILLVTFGAAVLSRMATLGSPFATGAMFGSALTVIAFGVLLFSALFIPVMMALWFAPALVVLRGMDAWPAMKASFTGCLRNILPFLIYGLIGIVLSIVATIPFLLGWLVVGPMTIASVYSGYCDIYEDR
jgi:uncharacterized membrane protein